MSSARRADLTFAQGDGMIGPMVAAQNAEQAQTAKPRKARRFNWIISDWLRKFLKYYLEWSARWRGQRFYCAGLAGESEYNLTINCDSDGFLQLPGLRRLGPYRRPEQEHVPGGVFRPGGAAVARGTGPREDCRSRPAPAAATCSACPNPSNAGTGHVCRTKTAPAVPRHAAREHGALQHRLPGLRPAVGRPHPHGGADGHGEALAHGRLGPRAWACNSSFT